MTSNHSTQHPPGLNMGLCSWNRQLSGVHPSPMAKVSQGGVEWWSCSAGFCVVVGETEGGRSRLHPRGAHGQGLGDAEHPAGQVWPESRRRQEGGGPGSWSWFFAGCDGGPGSCGDRHLLFTVSVGGSVLHRGGPCWLGELGTSVSSGGSAVSGWQTGPPRPLPRFLDLVSGFKACTKAGTPLGTPEAEAPARPG